MSKFITTSPLMKQDTKVGIWVTAQNQLFRDNDGTIYFVPRNYQTDNYTIPDWLAWLGGDNGKWDVRPSHFHDLLCQTHCAIIVQLNELELRYYRYIKDNQGIVTCRDIPAKYLRVVKVNKKFADNLFKRMMIATKRIPHLQIDLMRFAVFFNFGWLSNYNRCINLNYIYNGADKFIY